MRFFTSVVIISTLLFAGACGAGLNDDNDDNGGNGDNGSSGGVTVMTWNVENFQNSGAYTRIAEAVKANQAAVLVLCEMQTDDSDASSFESALSTAGYSFAWSRQSSMSDSYNAIGVWSRWEISNPSEILKGIYTDPVSSQSKWCPRAVYRFMINVNDSQQVWFYACHFKAGNDESAEQTRRAQAYALENYIKSIHQEAAEHIVVLGDMNTIDSRGELTGDASTLGRLTLKSDNPGDTANDFTAVNLTHLGSDAYTSTSYSSRLDHIILSPAAYGRYETGSVSVYHPPQFCSDHYPVLVRLSY